MKRSGPLRRKTSRARKDTATFNAGTTGTERCAAQHLTDVLGPCDTFSRTEGDHFADRSLRPDLRGNPDNRQPLCPVHHRWKTDHPKQARELGLKSDESYELANQDPMAKIRRQLGATEPLS